MWCYHFILSFLLFFLCFLLFSCFFCAASRPYVTIDKIDCSKANVPARKVLDSLAFRIEIAHLLGTIQKRTEEVDIELPRRRGGPSHSPRSAASPGSSKQAIESDSDDDTIPKLKQSRQSAPAKEVRQNKIEHLPVFGSAKSQNICKMQDCTGKTFVICSKCNVYLCCKREKSCFFEYHKYFQNFVHFYSFFLYFHFLFMKILHFSLSKFFLLH